MAEGNDMITAADSIGGRLSIKHPSPVPVTKAFTGIHNKRACDPTIAADARRVEGGSVRFDSIKLSR